MKSWLKKISLILIVKGMLLCVITSVFAETGYISGVPDYQNDDYPGSNDCAPTASACVLGYYDDHGYEKLVDGGNSTNGDVASLVQQLKSAMDWSPILGTSFKNIPIGIEAVCNDPSFENNYDFHANNFHFTSWSMIKTEIDEGRPSVYSVLHPAYGSHAVALVGYEETTIDQIVIVHDNWKSTPEDVTLYKDDIIADCLTRVFPSAGGGDPWDPIDDSASNGTTLIPSLTVQSHGLHTLDDIYDDPDISDRFDWYKIHMTAEYTYYFYSTGNGDTCGELFNVPYIGSPGNPVAEDDDSGGNDQFSFSYTPTVSQTYYLRVYAYEPWSGYINYYYASPPPDLIISNINVPSSASPGDTVTVYSSVKNQSDYPAKSFFLEFYLSTDNIITDDDKSLVSRHIDGLDAHETISHITDVEIPSSLGLGTHYIGAIADSTQAVKETKEDNNTGYDSIDIIDAVAPLAPINLVCNPATWTNVNSFTIDWTNPDDTSGIVGAYYKLNSAPTHDTDGYYVGKPFSVSATMEGGQIIYVWLKDGSGNVDHNNRNSATIYYDGTAPTFPMISSSLDISKTGDLTITVKANEELKETPTIFVQQYSHSGSTISVTGSGKNWTGSYVITAGYDGKATINVTGKDLAGNIGTGSGSFVVDTTPPKVFISLSKPTPLKTGMADVTLQIEDATGISGKPELKCTFSDNTTIDIPLTGSGNTWKGSFFIESTTPEGNAQFSWQGYDLVGNKGSEITSGKNFEIDTTILASAGGIVSNSDGTKIDIPANAVNQDINIEITKPDPDSAIIQEANSNLTGDFSIRPIKTGNTNREIIATSDATGSIIEEMNGNATITIPYPDENQDGIVDGTDIRESTLKMFCLNYSNRKWELIDNSEVNATENNVKATVSHFSIFSVMGYFPIAGFSEVKVYPNPCRTNVHNEVKIANLPKETDITIYVYNIAGELVRKIQNDELEIKVASKLARWNCRNNAGRKVASGIYIYLIKSDSNKKTGKIAIIR